MGTRHLTVAGLSAAVLAVGLVTGCAQGSGTPSAGGSTAASTSPTADSGASTTPSQSASPGAPAPGGGADGGTPAAGDLTVSGQVETGAEPTCLILRSNGSTYELLDGDRNVVKAGNTVTVTGHVVTGVMSHCMQGKMLRVTQAHAN